MPDTPVAGPLQPGRSPGAAAPVPGDPVIRARLQLGGRLRELREQAGITGGKAAAAIGATCSKVYRIEAGQVPVRDRDARDLAGLYEAAGLDADADELTSLAAQGRKHGWWDDYAKVIPPAARHRLALEAAATRVVAWEPECVPVLLQTPAYAAAVTDPLSGHPLLERLSPPVHRHRQALLTARLSPRLWAVISEAALIRSPDGDPAVMADQLAHLASLAAERHICVQVLPLRDSSHLSCLGAFSILRFELAAAVPCELPDIVAARSLASPPVTGQQDTDRAWQAFMAAAVHAITPEQTTRLLRQAVGDGGWTLQP